MTAEHDGQEQPPGNPAGILAKLEAQGIEYKSPEYWAYLQDRAGKK